MLEAAGEKGGGGAGAMEVDGGRTADILDRWEKSVGVMGSCKNRDGVMHGLDDWEL